MKIGMDGLYEDILSTRKMIGTILRLEMVMRKVISFYSNQRGTVH